MYSIEPQWLHRPKTDVPPHTQTRATYAVIAHMHVQCLQTVTVMQVQKLRKLKLVACVARYKREMGTQSLWRVVLRSVEPVSCHIEPRPISRWLARFGRSSTVRSSPWGHNTRACICNMPQRSAAWRWNCMWRAELDLSPTVSLHNQSNLHAWVLLKVSVFSYFLSRWWGRECGAAAGHRVIHAEDWAQRFWLTFDLTLCIFRLKKGPTQKPWTAGTRELPAWHGVKKPRA